MGRMERDSIENAWRRGRMERKGRDSPSRVSCRVYVGEANRPDNIQRPKSRCLFLTSWLLPFVTVTSTSSSTILHVSDI